MSRNEFTTRIVDRASLHLGLKEASMDLIKVVTAHALHVSHLKPFLQGIQISEEVRDRFLQAAPNLPIAHFSQLQFWSRRYASVHDLEITVVDRPASWNKNPDILTVPTHSIHFVPDT